MDRFLAVTDKDLSYGRRLCNFINEKKTANFSAVSFCSVEEYLEFSKAHNVALHILDGETFEEYKTACGDERSGYDIGEAAEEAESPEDGLINERTVFLYKSRLLPGETEELLRGDKAFGVYKYCSAEEIMRKAMEIYGRSTGRLKYVDNLVKTRITGVYSPLGRCKRTTFSLLLCEAYAKKKKVLYINLEEFSGFYAFVKEEPEADLSDVLYYLKENSLDFPRLKAFIYSMKNFDYIPPVRHPEDTAGAEINDYINLMESISEIGDYEVIVLDMQSFSGCASELLELCDEIYMPVLDDFISKEKIKAFDDYMTEAKRFKLMERIRKISLPEKGEASVLPDYLDSLIYSETGDFVRGLTV